MVITLQESWPVACIGWLYAGSAHSVIHLSVAYEHSSISNPANSSSSSMTEFQTYWGEYVISKLIQGEGLLIYSERFKK